MKISFLLIGKTQIKYLQEGIADYQKRLQHYHSFEIKVIPTLKKSKNLAITAMKNKEGELILQQFLPGDFVVLLDESGKSYTSMAFADFLQSLFNRHIRQLYFVVGGAYGFSPEVYARADARLSLSSMTFSHQMVRLIFVEQLYRAFTILKGEPYHHE
ncbi:MAG: 23S rRNA (pseudouridine(1915)-N(3))-methyltransferase RlmH [Chitinophagales bacterium]